jgi:hypothetical protein
LCATKARSDRDRGYNDQHAQGRKHAAPAQEIADQAGGRSAQQISSHCTRKRPPDRDLAPFGADEIAGQSQRDRKHAARADAGEDACRKQQRKRARQRAEDIGEPQQDKAGDHQPRLAEEIGGRSDQRLDGGKGEGEDRRKACGSRDAD